MFQLDQRPCPRLPRRPAATSTGVDEPLFELLRSTLGLPVDDPRWWHAAAEDERAPLEVLERVLAGLRAWDTDPPAPRQGRHMLRVVPGLVSRP
jgi:hypothetical protein